MTTQTLQDEDLIILSDDSSSNDIFNFDTNVVASAPTSDIIDFGTDEISFETDEISFETSSVSPVSLPEVTHVVEENVENNDF